MPKSWLVRGAEAAERSRRLMELRGVTPNGHPLWERWEVEPVLEWYPAYRTIFPALERRTHLAVYQKAGRLGVTKPRAPSWTDNEILRLRRFYPKGTPQEILEAFPGRSIKAVAKAANKRGIFRTKKSQRATGIRILDQIFSRAAGNGYTLQDLDALTRSPGYFTKRRWKASPDPAIHCRAVRAMGGTVRASFE